MLFFWLVDSYVTSVPHVLHLRSQLWLRNWEAESKGLHELEDKE